MLDAAVAAGVPRSCTCPPTRCTAPAPPIRSGRTQKLPGEGLATSAYARSKALADDLALSYADRLDVVVARPTNCIGPWQHPEKAVPRWATRALRGERLPVWGDGSQVRDWMFVDDAVSGLRLLAERGERGEVYNLGPAGRGRAQRRDRPDGRAGGGRDDGCRLPERTTTGPSTTAATPSRPSGSPRWAGAASRSLEAAIAETVAWYRDHAAWWWTLVPDAEGLYAD